MRNRRPKDKGEASARLPSFPLIHKILSAESEPKGYESQASLHYIYRGFKSPIYVVTLLVWVIKW